MCISSIPPCGQLGGLENAGLEACSVLVSPLWKVGVPGAGAAFHRRRKAVRQGLDGVGLETMVREAQVQKGEEA